MSQPLSVDEVDPGAYQAALGLERDVRRSDLEKPAVRADQDPRLPAQRLRILPRHASP